MKWRLHSCISQLSNQYGMRVWKGLDWDVLDRLHEKGYISNPKSKAKSVGLSEEAAKQSEELFKKHFCS